MPSTFVVSFCQQVPPEILLQKGVHLSRCVQSPHQFVVVFPRSYTATISCGYTLAESAHFATKDWIQLGLKTATVGYLTEIDKHIYQCWNAENSHMVKYKEFYDRSESMLCTWMNIVSEGYHGREVEGAYSVHNESTAHLNMEFNKLLCAISVHIWSIFYLDKVKMFQRIYIIQQFLEYFRLCRCVRSLNYSPWMNWFVK